MRHSGVYLTDTAGQWTGSVLRVCERALFAIVHVCETQGRGRSCGLAEGNAPGGTVSLAKTTINKQPGFVNKLTVQDMMSPVNSLRLHLHCSARHALRILNSFIAGSVIFIYFYECENNFMCLLLLNNYPGIQPLDFYLKVWASNNLCI